MGSILRKRLQTGGLLVLLLLTASLGWGQGHETFTNVPTTTPGSYSVRTWTGDNGEEWNATDARTDQTIVGKAITVRNGELSTTILGGIGNLTLSTQRKFSGGSGVVTISVNGTEVGTIPYDDTVQTATISGIDVSGNVTLLVETPGNGDRVAMDDLIWTSFGGGGNTPPFITNVTQNPASNAVTSSDAVTVSADIMDSDGIASAELHWGTVSGSLNNTIAMSLDAVNTYVINSAIPAQSNGTTIYYEIEATDANTTPETSTSPEQSYTVDDPLPFGIPYFNAFGNQDDYDEAVGYGFEFTNANQNGSYVHIISGSIVTPAVDFSAYAGLTVSFDLGTFGGPGGQLDVSVSNDNGVNYTLLGTFTPTSSTPSGFEQIIDLTSLNGTNGRIKFEQTAGSSNSLRFKSLNIEESTGGNSGPVISNIIQNPAVVSSSDTVLVSADIEDLDGIASAELRWGTTSGSLSNTIAMSLDAGNTYAINSAIPAQSNGTTVYYEIEATDSNAVPISTTSPEQSYTVADPLSFSIPYFNAFGNQDDYDEAVGYGFEFTNANQNGTYVLITSGSIVSPAIDFSAYAGLAVSFDLGTYGGPGAQLEVSVSNDNGVNYTLLGTFTPTSSTPSDFEQIIDLSSLNGTNGRIKFEQTTGSPNSLRFKNLNIEESTGGNSGPVISNITQSPALVTSSDDVLVSADIEDLDGIASAELHWGTTSGSLSNTIAMSLDTGNTYVINSAIPAQANGTTVYYEIEATDANGTPLTTTSPEQSYTVVDPTSFTLPYSNGLRNQVDYDEAVGFGFVFNNATLTTTGGGYIKINSTGNIVSPAIDFSSYERLLVSFSLTTFGGASGQELTVFVSNDNGANYTPLDTFIVLGTYITFEQFIDVSSLNGTNGRIKFEMTGGTNSIRFRDLDMLEFEGYFYSNGSWSPVDPSGVSTDTDDLYINDGTATLTADTGARNITVNTGATLNIEKTLTIAGNINNNGNLVFVSTATGNGELAAVPSGSSINGDITVQRYMSHNRAYRMISSPVTTVTTIHNNWQEGATSNTDNPNQGFGTHITGTLIDQENGFDATATGNPSMFRADVASQTFLPIDNTDVNTLTAGESYLLFVRGDRSIDLTNDLAANETVLRATGSLFTGTNTQTLSGATAAGDFVMFGNPYQSVVDINAVFTNSSNINSGFYYVYDPTLADHGSYVTVSLPDGGNNTSDSDANQYLQPGQGAQVATAAAGDAVVVFNESNKTPGNFTATNRNGNRFAADNMLITQLYTAENFNNGGPVHDSFGIIFAEGNDNGLTPEDAVKPMNFYENLGIDRDGTLLSIESREMPQSGEVFALFSNGYQNTEYVLKLIIDGLEDSVFYLDDQFTGDSTLFELGETSYSFSIDASNPLSIATDRFSIRVEDGVVGVDSNNLLSGIRLYPNPLTDDTFYIKAPKLNGEQLTVSVNDLSGRMIFEQTLDCIANTVTVSMSSNLASGIYLVTLKYGGESQAFRMIKQ